METREFETLLAICGELAGLFPDGIVFIGGIAVYLHTVNVTETRELAELTHDADFYISLADMADLRDLEEVTANRRLSKHQLIKRGFEFDIYTERQAALIVPYDAVRARSESRGGIRVASLDHLLVLKLEAFRDRKGSAKGDKDAMDLIRIAAAAAHDRSAFDAHAARPYFHEDHLELLERVERGPHALALAHGNAKRAKGLRQDLSRMIDALEPARTRRRR